MNIAIRADASARIGTGHVMRCLTLADALKARGAHVEFLSVDLPPHLESLIARRGHGLAREEKSAGADLLIVDHYDLDARWEKAARSWAKRVIVVDDLADRPHDCDLLLDATFGEDGSRYEGLIPKSCRGLYGSTYVLLRPQFAEARARGLKAPAGAPAAHVFFGGVDFKAHTTRFSALLARTFPDIRLEIVVGESYADGAGLDRLQKEFPGRVRWEMEVADMAEHMGRCALAIGAPGTAIWERACMGLSSAYLAIHDNQLPILERLEAKGLCRSLGDADVLSDEAFVAGAGRFLADSAGLSRMRETGLSAVDGKGTERVADAVLQEVS